MINARPSVPVSAEGPATKRQLRSAATRIGTIMRRINRASAGVAKLLGYAEHEDIKTEG